MVCNPEPMVDRQGTDLIFRHPLPYIWWQPLPLIERDPHPQTGGKANQCMRSETGGML